MLGYLLTLVTALAMLAGGTAAGILPTHDENILPTHDENILATGGENIRIDSED